MQENHYDGSVILTDRATPEQLLAALGDPRNKTVAAHNPGSAVKLPDGSEFVAQADGSWARLKSAVRGVRDPSPSSILAFRSRQS